MPQHFYPSQEKQGVIGAPRGTGKLPDPVLASRHCCHISNVYSINNISTERQ